jgi:uncharacterized Ntn-hydrolase superfamily protein
MGSPRRTLPPLIAILVSLVISQSSVTGQDQPPHQASSSYAILARDPLTGQYGVAAASHAPLIGMNLEFIDPDLGGVIVLGGPYLELNERIVTALRDSVHPRTAIAVGLAADDDKESRQVLALTPDGAAAFTGKKLRKRAGERVGDFFVVAGNRLANDDVIEAMADAFSQFDGSLTDGLLLALQAGQEAGGESDGEHSAALLVVGPGSRFATRDRLVDLRIDYVPTDAVAALVELRARVDSVYGVAK